MNVSQGKFKLIDLFLVLLTLETTLMNKSCFGIFHAHKYVWNNNLIHNQINNILSSNQYLYGIFATFTHFHLRIYPWFLTSAKILQQSLKKTLLFRTFFSIFAIANKLYFIINQKYYTNIYSRHKLNNKNSTKL